MNRFLTALLMFALCSAPALVSADPDAAARVELDAGRSLYDSGNWETAKEAYSKAVDAASPSSPVRAEALLEHASILWEQGSYAEAQAMGERALQLAKRLKLHNAVGRLLVTLGHIDASRGKLKKAESTFKLCVDLSEKQRDDAFAALCRIQLRFVKQLGGRRVSSEASYRRDLATLKKTGRPLAVGTSLAKLAELNERAGDSEGALALLKEANKYFADSLPAQSRNKLRIAQVLQNRGEWTAAEAQIDGLETTLKNMNNRPTLVTLYALQGRAAAKRGNIAKAKGLLNRAAKGAGGLSSPHLRANTHLALCELHVDAREDSEATKVCTETAEMFRKAGAPSLAARALTFVAQIEQRGGNLRRARELYAQVLNDVESSVAITAENRLSIARQWANLCNVEVQLAASGALTRCRKALNFAAKLPGDSGDVARVRAVSHLGVALSAERDKNSKVAIKSFEAAARAYETAADKRAAAQAWLRLGVNQGRVKGGEPLPALQRGMKLLDGDAEAASLRMELRAKLVEAQLSAGDWQAANKEAEVLLVETQKAGKGSMEAWTHSARARALLKLGDRDAAIRTLRLGLISARRARDADMAGHIGVNLQRFKALDPGAKRDLLKYLEKAKKDAGNQPELAASIGSSIETLKAN